MGWREIVREHDEAECLRIYEAEFGKPVDDADVQRVAMTHNVSTHAVIALRIADGRADLYGIRARPREGFVLPEVGDTITVLVDHQLCEPIVDRWQRVLFDGVLRAGTTGTVSEVRAPGVQYPGYVGLCVRWNFKHAPTLVLRWDVVDDPTKFAFSKPEA